MTVYTNNYKSANEIVESEVLKTHNYEAFIKFNTITKKGIVFGVPTEMDIEEIKSEIKTEMQIVDIYRVTYYENNKEHPTQRVVVTFRITTLEESIKIYGVNKKLRPYINKTILCKNCLRYNHRENNCKAKKRCDRCAEEHNEDQCENSIKCIYCKEDHKTTDIKKCNEFQRQQKINKIIQEHTRTKHTKKQ